MNSINPVYESLMKNYILLIEGDRQFFSRFKLSQVRFFALQNISQNPAISLTELSKKLLCTKGNTTRIIQGMVSDDLLTVTKNPTDQRATNLHLTDKGLEIFNLVNREFDEFNRKRFNLLKEHEDKLIEYNAMIADGLENSLKGIDR